MATTAALNLIPQGEPLGEYVTRIRNARSMSKTELARRAQVHLTTVFRLESGRVGGQKVKHQVQKRLAAALQVPVEYLRAAAKGLEVETATSNQVCSQCWIPGTFPDTRWGFPDAKFCLCCGEGLVSGCACGEPILLRAKFCPECGMKYENPLKR